MSAHLETILEEAARVVDGPREKSYGPPNRSFERIAALWSQVLDIKVTPQQVGLCMVLLKVSRECNRHQRDNLVDIAGYARAMEKLNETAPESPLVASDRPEGA